jgi:hypothetical protein
MTDQNDTDPNLEKAEDKPDYPRTLAELLEKFSTKKHPKKELPPCT